MKQQRSLNIENNNEINIDNFILLLNEAKSEGLTHIKVEATVDSGYYDDYSAALDVSVYRYETKLEADTRKLCARNHNKITIIGSLLKNIATAVSLDVRGDSSKFTVKRKYGKAKVAVTSDDLTGNISIGKNVFHYSKKMAIISAFNSEIADL